MTSVEHCQTTIIDNGLNHQILNKGGRHGNSRTTTGGRVAKTKSVPKAAATTPTITNRNKSTGSLTTVAYTSSALLPMTGVDWDASNVPVIASAPPPPSSFSSTKRQQQPSILPFQATGASSRQGTSLVQDIQRTNSTESSPLLGLPSHRRYREKANFSGDDDGINNNIEDDDPGNLTDDPDSPRPRLSESGTSVPSLLEYYNSGFHSNSPYLSSFYNKESSNYSIIRFQVVIWQIGQVDMVQARVPVTFRVTIFWNTTAATDGGGDFNSNAAADSNNNDAVSLQGSHKSNQSSSAAAVWRMLGRQQAVQQPAPIVDSPTSTVDVPPVSILNVSTFHTIGEAEVSVLRENESDNSKLMRWSCMYRATLCQDHWAVDDFPHDAHEISLRLAILAHRQAGDVWDRSVWKLGLATADDSQGSVRIPHGLVVDQVSIPEFQYNSNAGLKFEFQPLDHGSDLGRGVGRVGRDTCLNVKLKVLRNSSYYDRNIMPLLGMLNFVAVSITALEDKDFFERALLTLNIAFVEIGMRMTADSKLPTASYQIKMQKILNEYFFCLLFLVLESLLVYEMQDQNFFASYTRFIDCAAALAVFSHNSSTLYMYYADARRVNQAMFGEHYQHRRGQRI